MFYCENCREKRDYPESFMRSYGKCEMCGSVAVCYDVNSSILAQIRRERERKDKGAR
jgi:transcription initiation factor IIE alpha subunit